MQTNENQIISIKLIYKHVRGTHMKLEDWHGRWVCPSKAAYISITFYTALHCPPLSIVMFSVYVSIPVQGGSAKVTLSPPLYGCTAVEPYSRTVKCVLVCAVVCAVSTGRCLAAKEPGFISEQ